MRARVCDFTGECGKFILTRRMRRGAAQQTPSAQQSKRGVGAWNGGRFALRAGQSVAVLASASGRQTEGSDGAFYPNGIARYIAEACPAPGMDGRFREKPLAYTMQYPFVRVTDIAALPTPGSWTNCFLTNSQMSKINANNGKVIVTFLEEDVDGFLRVPASKSGSYACMAIVCGNPVAEEGEEGYSVHFHSLQRVAIQALNQDSGYAQAAELTDRWVYFVRAGAVEEFAAADAELEGVGSEVKTALRDIVDAGQELLDTLDDIQVLHRLLTGSPSSPWQEMIKWASDVQCGPNVPSLLEKLLVAERLSFGAFQGESLADGDDMDILMALRRKAMECTDLGMRVDDALMYSARMLKKLRARAALAQL
eukprot:CAMPEP_0117665310 /NCGR_PEP_ID=MMETSP0804-20121206/9739_1 /TAXON_ID=1074897 /ORGANISM="Tetraselmis astigmatica, Strain CCMP880" /LENGTH=366 /DNA_ID=CAMNT_0005472709 /DNA_START=151 /DNA_END=1251 /DNA_ORIENTATION=-